MVDLPQGAEIRPAVNFSLQFRKNDLADNLPGNVPGVFLAVYNGGGWCVLLCRQIIRIQHHLKVAFGNVLSDIVIEGLEGKT